MDSRVYNSEPTFTQLVGDLLHDELTRMAGVDRDAHVSRATGRRRDGHARQHVYRAAAAGFDVDDQARRLDALHQSAERRRPVPALPHGLGNPGVVSPNRAGREVEDREKKEGAFHGAGR